WLGWPSSQSSDGAFHRARGAPRRFLPPNANRCSERCCWCNPTGPGGRDKPAFRSDQVVEGRIAPAERWPPPGSRRSFRTPTVHAVASFETLPPPAVVDFYPQGVYTYK